MKLKELGIVAAITSLAACGGSGTPTIEDVISFTDLTIADFADLDPGEIEDLVQDFEDEVDDLDFTDLSSLPSIGSLNYSGIAGVAGTERDQFGNISTDFEVEDALAFGEMSLRVSLNGDTVTGSISEIRNADEGDAISGTLDISGELLRDVDLSEDFGIRGGISGSLTDAEDGEFTVDTDLVADIFGSGAEFVSGNGIGTAEFEQGTVDITIRFGLESDD